MRFHDTLKRKVVSTSTAQTVGRVSGFLVDPDTRSVVGLECRKTESGSVIPWSSLTAVGEDAVTVGGADSIVAAEGRLAELSEKSARVLGKRVLSTAGDELGKVADVDFDPADGSLVSILLDQGEVPGSRLVGVGSYAVVVSPS